MGHATPGTKLAVALTSAAIACGAVAPAATAHYGSVAAATDDAAVQSTPTEDDSPWLYAGVSGALLSGGLLFTAARRRSRRAGATGLPVARG
jgi:hypothetical protein